MNNEWWNIFEGKVEVDKKASDWSWLQVGGAPSFTFNPSSIEEIMFFLKKKPYDFPFRVFGAGSNVLVRDNGFEGAFIRLKKAFRNVEFDGSDVIIGSGVLGKTLALVCAENDIGGFSFMATIPGMIGGMCFMNAGAHGVEFSDIIKWVEILDESGKLHRLNNSECGFSYRKSSFPKNSIILKVCLKGEISKSEDINKEIRELIAIREKTQPYKGKIAGCFFKNLDSKKAWELVKESDYAEFSNDLIEVSDIHSNFLINKSGSALDIEMLLERIRANVFYKTGMWLEREIEVVGY